MKKIRLTETELIRLITKKIKEQFNDEDMDSENMDIDDESTEKIYDFDVTSDLDEVLSATPSRRFRGSLYIDASVPKTDDVEADRALAMKVMEHFSKELDIENYVGGVGFKTNDITKPFDGDF